MMSYSTSNGFPPIPALLQSNLTQNQRKQKQNAPNMSKFIEKYKLCMSSKKIKFHNLDPIRPFMANIVLTQR